MNNYKKYLLLLLLNLSLLTTHKLLGMMEVLPAQEDVVRWGQDIQQSLDAMGRGPLPGATLVGQQAALKRLYLERLELKPEIDEIDEQLASHQRSLEEEQRQDQLRQQAGVLALHQRLQAALRPTLEQAPGSYQDITTNIAALIRQLQGFDVQAPAPSPRIAELQRERVALQRQRERWDELQRNVAQSHETKTRAAEDLSRRLTGAGTDFNRAFTDLQRNITRTKDITAQKKQKLDITAQINLQREAVKDLYEENRKNILEILWYPKLPEGVDVPVPRAQQPPAERAEAQERLNDATIKINEALPIITQQRGTLPSRLDQCTQYMQKFGELFGRQPQEADLTPGQVEALQETFDVAKAREDQLQELYEATQTRLASFGYQVLRGVNPNHPVTLTQDFIIRLLTDDGMAQADAEVLLTLTPEEIEQRIEARKTAIVQKLDEFLASPDMKIRLRTQGEWYPDEEYNYLDLLKKIVSVKNEDKEQAKQILTAILNKIRIRTARGDVDLSLIGWDADQTPLSIVSRFFVMSLCLFLKDKFEKSLKQHLELFINETRNYLAVILLSSNPTANTVKSFNDVQLIKKIIDAQDAVLQKTTAIKVPLCAAYLRAFPINECEKFHVYRLAPEIISPFPGGYNTREGFNLTYHSATFKTVGGAYFLARNLLTLNDGFGYQQNDDLLTTIARKNLQELSTTPVTRVSMPDTPGIDAGGLTRNFFSQMYGAFFGFKLRPENLENYAHLDEQLKEPNAPNLTNIVKLLSAKTDETQTDHDFNQELDQMNPDEKQEEFVNLIHTNHLFGALGKDLEKKYQPAGGQRQQVVSFQPIGTMPDIARFKLLTGNTKTRCSLAYKALGRFYFLCMAQSRPIPSLAAHIIYSALERSFNPAQQKLGMLLEFFLRYNPGCLKHSPRVITLNIGNISHYLQLLSLNLRQPEQPFKPNEVAGLDQETGRDLTDLKQRRQINAFKQNFLDWMRTSIKLQIGGDYQTMLRNINDGFWDMPSTRAAEGLAARGKNDFIQCGLRFFNKVNTYLHAPAQPFFVDEDYRVYSGYMPLNSSRIQNSPEVTQVLMQEVIGFLSAYDFAQYFAPTIDVAIIRGLLQFTGNQHELFREAFMEYLDENAGNQEELKNLLIFISGAPVPLAPLRINIIAHSRDNTAHTCFARWDIGVDLINETIADLGAAATREQQKGALKDLIRTLSQGDAGMNVG